MTTPRRCIIATFRHKQNPSPRIFLQQAGTGIAEYALIGGLVVILVIGTMTAMGQNVGNLFNTILSQLNVFGTPAPIVASGTAPAELPTLQPQTPTPVPISGQPSADGPLTPITISATNGQSLSALGVGQIEVKLPNGGSYRLTVPDSQNILETVGPSGVTEVYLAQMERFITSLRESLPAGDPLQADLAALASTGHSVRNEQAAALTYLDRLLSDHDLNNAPLNGTGLMCNSEQCAKYTFNNQKDPFERDSSTMSKYDNAASSLGKKAVAIAEKMTARGMDGPKAALEYYSGNIIRATHETGLLLETQNWSPTSDTSQILRNMTLTEYNANGICDMSQHTTCFRKDGHAVSTTP